MLIEHLNTVLSRGKTGTFVGAFNKEMPLVGARDFLWAVVKLREVSLPALLLAAVPHESGQQACDTMIDGRGGYLHVTLPGTGLL